MDDISEGWKFIGDIPDTEFSDDGFRPPVAKSSRALPPPTLQHHPRTPAVFQVPPELRASISSQVVSSPADFSHSGCKVTKDDLSTFSWKSAGFHRASPYQVTDLQLGVNDRPIREGYQPQSFKLQSKPPQSLQSTGSKPDVISDLPPAPEILQRNLEQQVSTRAKTTRRRGGSTNPSDSPIITGKFDALLREFGPLSDVYQALQQSQFADAHRDRLLNAFGASTVFRYLQSVQQFSNTRRH